ncbi:MAG: carboxylating nicotinate-nucleotide diphosphorylase, partial [Burkholderiales bacterium]
VQAAILSQDPKAQITWYVQDGGRCEANQVVFEVQGNAQALLTAERTALNFLQLLSAVATKTAKYVAVVAGTRAAILDTRKTLPGLRAAQKYAVVVGGGVNHRFGLYDAILIKENHIMATGGITTAVKAALENSAKVPVIVEVENLAEVEEAFAAGAQWLLLDNFPAHNLVRAAQIAQQRRRINLGPSLLEASGNITMVNIRGIADSGVDYISVGSLTKNITAVDLSLRFQPE